MDINVGLRCNIIKKMDVLFCISLSEGVWTSRPTKTERLFLVSISARDFSSHGFRAYVICSFEQNGRQISIKHGLESNMVWVQRDRA